MGQCGSTENLKLTYFDLQARGESIRYTFAVGKIQFSDERITFEQWPTLKPNTVMGSLPELQINNTKVGQSLAIGRFAAKCAKLYGSNPEEEGVIDMVVDTINDVREGFITIKSKKLEGEAKKSTMDSGMKQLQNLEKLLGDKSYFSGNKISWADIHFYACMEMICLGSPKALNDLPNLDALWKRVDTNSEIVAYKERRPDVPIVP